jgi:periplasmic protein CpxP/Spy
MNDKRKWIGLWVMVGLLLLLNIGTLGWVAYRAKQIRSLRHNPQRMLENRLNFTPDQQARYQRLRAEFEQAGQVHRDSLRQLRDGLLGQLGGNVPDNELNNMLAQMERHNGQLMRLRFRHWQQVRTLCTPDQQTRFDRMVSRLTRSTPDLKL